MAHDLIVPGAAGPPVLPGALAVPAPVADAGEAAARRYLEFFTANIRNPNTRLAYARACSSFLAWCERLGLALPLIQPVHVAAWVEQLGRDGRAALCCLTRKCSRAADDCLTKMLPTALVQRAAGGT